MQFSRLLVLTGLSLGCALASAQAAQDAQRSGPGQQGPQGQQGQQGQGNQEHHRPPAEALAACKSLASGAACSFTSPRGAESGTCFAPNDKPLACRPQRGAGGPDQGPAQGKPTN